MRKGGKNAANLELFHQGARNGGSSSTHMDGVVGPLLLVAFPAGLALQDDHTWREGREGGRGGREEGQE